jgi:bifunctional pyridoxal-dependent enzyme with beta-cystathionase and maltose regulon repressor activities
MPYDASLDVSTFKEVLDFVNTRLTVGVFSYNGAPKKLQISRENLIEEKWSYTKLGRLSKDEAIAVAPIMMKAIETM